VPSVSFSTTANASRGPLWARLAVLWPTTSKTPRPITDQSAARGNPGGLLAFADFPGKGSAWKGDSACSTKF
jgi:hypothetical protein